MSETDIVARLRGAARALHDGGLDFTADAASDAADEIERLRAQVAAQSPPERVTCGKCRWWDGQRSNVGRCYRKSAQLTNGRKEWPVTDWQDYCGEAEAREAQT